MNKDYKAICPKCKRTFIAGDTCGVFKGKDTCNYCTDLRGNFSVELEICGD